MWSQEDEEQTLYKVPSSLGDRCIVCHLGSPKSGLLDGCLPMYRGAKAKRSDDDQKEMCTEAFLNWMKTKVFPKWPLARESASLYSTGLHITHS